MPKVKVQQHIKVHDVVNEFHTEFSKTPMNELFCKLSKCVVTWLHAQKVFRGKPQPNGSLKNQEATCECVDVLTVNVWMYAIHFVYVFFCFILVILKIKLYRSLKSQFL